MRPQFRVVSWYDTEGFGVEMSHDSLRWQPMEVFPTKKEAIFYAKQLDIHFNAVKPANAIKEIHWRTT